MTAELELLVDVADDVLGSQRPSSELWDQLVELEWPRLALDDIGHLAAVLEVAGRRCVDVPLAEAALACALLEEAGLDYDPARLVTLAARADVRLSDGRLHGRAARVAWGRRAAAAIVPVGDVTVLVHLDGVRVDSGENLAGEARDDLVFESTRATVLDVAPAFVRGALARAAATVGALDAAHALSREHVTTRTQFDRPLLRFQLVGRHLAVIAGEVHAARQALAGAVAAHRSGLGVDEQTAVAKIVSSRAAGLVARSAHQVHGAMGTTREYPLHLATRRLWSWREEWGGERHWARALAAHMAARGPDGAWELIVA